MEVPDVTTHEPVVQPSPASTGAAPAQVDDAGDMRVRVAEEKATMARLLQEDQDRGLVPGASYYLLDAKWFAAWKKFVDFEDENMREFPLPGPIDNKRLLENDESGSLRKSLVEVYDYVFLSQEAWQYMHARYGGGPVIERKCVESGSRRQPLIEVRPLCLKVVYSGKVKAPKSIMVSKSATLRQFIALLQPLFGFDTERCRVFDFYNGRKYKQLDNWDKQLDEMQIMDGQLMLIEEKKKTGQWPNDKIYRRFDSSHGSSYTRAPTQPGKTGLMNLGNTCFMNSALQCLSSAAPIVDFLVSGKFQEDVNVDNPLGSKGAMAEAYAGVVTELWSSRTAVVDPREFKHVIAKIAPQFTGYSQHDSQELLAFLLDGLHEDLNRIKRKPYVEIKDSDGRPDEDVAKETWDGYMARNDSIVVDYFQGLLKSTLTCPVNGRVAVKFDPFMYLSVPLPVDNSRKIPIYLHYRDNRKPPTKFGVSTTKEARVADLKRALSKLCGIPVENLALMDVYVNRFHREFVDKDDVADIRDNDKVHAYEVSYTPPAEGKGAGQEAENNEETEPVIIHLPVLHRKLYQPRRYNRVLLGTPTVVSVPETVTYRELYAAIVKAITPSLKEPISEVVELDDEDDKNESDEETTDSDEIMLGRVKYSADTRSNQVTVNTIPTEPLYGGAFTIIPCNPWGQDTSRMFRNNDRPLGLRERDTVAVLWTREAKEKYFDAEKDSHFETDETAKGLEENLPLGRRSVAKSVSLYDCLTLFNTEEQLGPDDQWYCSDCQEFRQAFKKMDIWSAPKILVVHLKRFSYRGRNYRERLDHLVDFPLEGLDLTEFVIGPKEIPPIYDLFAVSNHYGSMAGGHYTAYARHRDDGKWYTYDDSSVHPVADPQSVVTTAAYLLLYRRRDVEWSTFDRSLEAAESEEEDSDIDDDNDDDNDDDEKDDKAVVEDAGEELGAGSSLAPAGAPSVRRVVGPAGEGAGHEMTDVTNAASDDDDGDVVSREGYIALPRSNETEALLDQEDPLDLEDGMRKLTF